MVWQTTPYTLPLLVSSLVCFGLTVAVAARTSRQFTPLVIAFVGVGAGAGGWALAYALQLSATSLSATLVWNGFVWMAVGLMLVAWPTFVFAFVGLTRWLRPVSVAVLSIVPLAVVLHVWLRGVSPLFYADPELVAINGYLVLEFVPGIGLLAVIAYANVLNVATFVLLGREVYRRRGRGRRQAAILLLAGLIPAGVTLVSIVGNVGPTFVDLTPIAFTATALLVGWVVFEYRLFDLTPVARDAVVSDLAEGVVVIDDEGCIVDCNDPARELFSGLQVGERVTTAFESHPEVQRVVSHAGPDDAHLRLDAEGDDEDDTRVVELSTLPIAGDANTGTVLLFRDVTERETLERRHRTLIEKSPNVITTVGTNGVVRYVSPSVERLLDLQPSAVEGRPFIEFLHPADRDAVTSVVEDARESCERHVVEHRIGRADGSCRQFESVVEPLFSGGGEVVVTGTDVTDARRYEQRLQVLNRALRHDLKNQVNVIGGYAELLRDHVDEPGQSHLDVIERKVAELASLGDQAREVEMTLDRGDHATVDLAELVSSQVDALRTTYPHATVTLSTPAEATVVADGLIDSAIRNVLENAVTHHDGEHPTVDVRVERNGDEYVVVVADDGPGMPAAEREVFEQDHETPLSHASGMGLWLVHWVVAESGGSVEITDNEPRGTVVRLRLPA